jgi:hypothetical protein
MQRSKHFIIVWGGYGDLFVHIQTQKQRHHHIYEVFGKDVIFPVLQVLQVSILFILFLISCTF